MTIPIDLPTDDDLAAMAASMTLPSLGLTWVPSAGASIVIEQGDDAWLVVLRPSPCVPGAMVLCLVWWEPPDDDTSSGVYHTQAMGLHPSSACDGLAFDGIAVMDRARTEGGVGTLALAASIIGVGDRVRLN